MAKEKRHFRMHTKLLMDVIKRQAGTLSKAVLEGVMNADDAKAKKVRITLDEDTLMITDDGEGFKSADNIKTFFEVFGQPHEESEGKKFGTFRMGRGQLFAYGANEWRTGRYRMHVDINTKGLEYDLVTDADDDVAGCSITVQLYEPIGLTGVDQVKRDIEKWCKWMYPIRVYVNGDMVSQNPELAKWDVRNEDVFFRLNEAGGLAVYNLGVHVRDYQNYDYGTGGEVVSRKQLKVNFARNDVQSDCPVWRKIKPQIDQRATTNNMTKKTLGDGERQRIADQLRRGEMEGNYTTAKLKIFTAVTGRHFDANDVMFPRHAKGRYAAYSVAPKNDQVGDTLMRCGRAFVFSQETLERFKFKTVPELLSWAKETFANDRDDDACSRPYRPFAELAKEFKRSYVVLDDADLTAQERLWLKLLDGTAHQLKVPSVEDEIYGYNGRRIQIGIAEHANGWTDGETYVSIARKYLAARSMDIVGITDVGGLLIHEACHHTPDTGEHDHNQEFYENFHDATRECSGRFVAACIAKLPTISDKLGKQLMKTVDKTKAAQRAVSKVTKVAADSSTT